MNKQGIQHIISSHYKKLEKQLNKIAADFDLEQIHQFRVTYKKLRAFLRMISLQNEPAEKLKISKKLNRFYHVSGLLRDLQLLQQRITATTKKELLKPSPRFDLLQEEMNRLKTVLSEIIATDPVAASERKTNKNIPGKFPVKKLRIYTKEKWQAVNEIIAAAHFTEQTLHTIRKIMKDLFYNLKKHKATGHKVLSKYIRNRTKFNKLLNELGDFHDLCAQVALLRSSWFKKLNQQQQQLLLKVKKEWMKEKAVKKHLLVIKLKTYFKIQATAR